MYHLVFALFFIFYFFIFLLPLLLVPHNLIFWNANQQRACFFFHLAHVSLFKRGFRIQSFRSSQRDADILLLPARSSIVVTSIEAFFKSAFDFGCCPFVVFLVGWRFLVNAIGMAGPFLLFFAECPGASAKLCCVFRTLGCILRPL